MANELEWWERATNWIDNLFDGEQPKESDLDLFPTDKLKHAVDTCEELAKVHLEQEKVVLKTMDIISWGAGLVSRFLPGAGQAMKHVGDAGLVLGGMLLNDSVRDYAADKVLEPVGYKRLCESEFYDAVQNYRRDTLDHVSQKFRSGEITIDGRIHRIDGLDPNQLRQFREVVGIQSLPLSQLKTQIYEGNSQSRRYLSQKSEARKRWSWRARRFHSYMAHKHGYVIAYSVPNQKREWSKARAEIKPSVNPFAKSVADWSRRG